MNVGVVMPTWLGDICMATPALAMLRSARPDATITAFAGAHAGALLDGHQSVDAVQAMSSRGVFASASMLRKASLDELWLLPGSFRWGMAARLSGVRRRIGYRRDARGWLLSDAVEQLDRRGCVSTVEWYAHLVRRVCDEAAPTPPMHLHVTHADRAAAADVLDAADGRRLAVLVPGATRKDKRWPGERFGALAAALHESHGLVSVIVGAPSEVDLAAQIKGAASHATIDAVSMQTNVSALKALIDAADVVISNDTGPRHIALCLGTPAVTLFGPTDQRWTAVADVKERRLVAEPFLPETLVADQCPDGCRIDRIGVSDVLHAVDDLLAAEPTEQAGI